MINRPLITRSVISFMLLIFALSTTMLSAANATEYVWKDCGSADRTKIRAAVKWLKTNLSKIDDNMGKRGLMSWPGKSRDKFIKKLDKKLSIRCRSAASKMCAPKEVGTGVFRTTRGRVIPILHQRRIDLCLDNIAKSGDSAREDTAYLTSVIAHEIAHLIRLNTHRTTCVKKYEKPRFSQSVGLATFHAYMQTRYQSTDYTSRCP